MRGVEFEGHELPIHLDEAPTARATVILGHGAGSTMESRLMNELAGVLVEQRVSVARFNFLYKALGRSMPDRMPSLMRQYAAIAASVREQSAGRLVIGGHSMGGRTASMLAARRFRCRRPAPVRLPATSRGSAGEAPRRAFGLDTHEGALLEWNSRRSVHPFPRGPDCQAAPEIVDHALAGRSRSQFRRAEVVRTNSSRRAGRDWRSRARLASLNPFHARSRRPDKTSPSPAPTSCGPASAIAASNPSSAELKTAIRPNGESRYQLSL